MAEFNPAPKGKGVFGPIPRAKLYPKPRAKLLFKWRVKGVSGPSSPGLGMEKGSGVHHPQPEGPSTSCGEGNRVSPELAGYSIFNKDLVVVLS